MYNIIYINFLNFFRFFVYTKASDTSETEASISLSFICSINSVLFYVFLCNYNYSIYDRYSAVVVFGVSGLFFFILNYFLFEYKNRYKKIYLKTNNKNNWFYSLLTFIWVIVTFYYSLKYI